LQDDRRGRELAELLSGGPPQGELLDRALRLVASEGSLRPARAAVTREVRRAREVAAELPAGPAKDALLNLTEYLAVRCGAAT